MERRRHNLLSDENSREVDFRRVIDNWSFDGGENFRLSPKTSRNAKWVSAGFHFWEEKLQYLSLFSFLQHALIALEAVWKARWLYSWLKIIYVIIHLGSELVGYRHNCGHIGHIICIRLLSEELLEECKKIMHRQKRTPVDKMDSSWHKRKYVQCRHIEQIAHITKHICCCTRCYAALHDLAYGIWRLKSFCRKSRTYSLAHKHRGLDWEQPFGCFEPSNSQSMVYLAFSKQLRPQ